MLSRYHCNKQRETEDKRNVSNEIQGGTHKDNRSKIVTGQRNEPENEDLIVHLEEIQRERE